MSTHDEPARDRDQATEAHGEPEDAVEQDAATAPTHPVPAPGEPSGDMWPGVHAVRADVDESDGVEDVEGIALAPPGKPDGEVDTRP